MELQQIAEVYRRRGYQVSVFENRAAAAQYLVDTIEGETVGIGGSQTIREMDVYDRLCGKNTVLWHWTDEKNRRLAAGATVYLCSVNAMAETGEMVNIDGTGNRLSASLYGPRRMIFAVGRNKIVPDLAAAMARAKASVIPNAKRLGMNPPCVRAGRCVNCFSPDRLCHATVIYERPMRGFEETEILLIDEELGF